jgi:hypothetical protein
MSSPETMAFVIAASDRQFSEQDGSLAAAGPGWTGERRPLNAVEPAIISPTFGVRSVAYKSRRGESDL